MSIKNGILPSSYGVGLLALFSAVMVAAPVQADPIRYLAEVSVAAWEFEVLCYGCPGNTQTQLISVANGGPDEASASHGYEAHGRVNASASATLDPTRNALPYLQARTGANVVIDPPPPAPLSIVYEYSAIATAQAIQLFTYHGLGTTEYELTFSFDATLFDDETVSAALVLYNGVYDPDATEGNIGHTNTVVDAWIETFTGPNGASATYAISKSISFNVDPVMDAFTVKAGLAVAASSYDDGEQGMADASHTFRVDFTKGDTTLLTPASSGATAPVPEPGSTVLLTSGVLLAILRRYRRHPRSRADAKIFRH